MVKSVISATLGWRTGLSHHQVLPHTPSTTGHSVAVHSFPVRQELNVCPIDYFNLQNLTSRQRAYFENVQTFPVVETENS
jgi:hypothetical protein